jgi:hypothetical protein
MSRLILCRSIFAGLTLLAWARSAMAEGQVDVTDKVRAAVKEQALSIAVENGTFGDPQPGDAKKLMVEFKLGDAADKKAVGEHGILEIKGSADKPLTIIKAIYGVEGGDLSSAPVPEPMVYGTTKSFRPTAKWLDDGGVHISGHGGGMLYHKKVYYWYGENRTRGKDGGVRCYSSANLYDWKNEGIAFAVSDDPSNTVARGCIIERPKVLFNKKTGKFVMWFHHELKGQGYNTARVGVAVADQPAGPFTFIESFKPNGQDSRDQTLFLDDDGKAYHICSSEGNGTLHITQLTEDFLKPAEAFTKAFPGKSYEAPAMFKRNGKYYIIGSGCTGWAPNPAKSAVADSILGPWTEFGNPWRGPDDKLKTSFKSQSTYVLPVQGRKDAFIFMADRWNPGNLCDSRFIWVPVEWEDGKPVFHWADEWSLSDF